MLQFYKFKCYELRSDSVFGPSAIYLSIVQIILNFENMILCIHLFFNINKFLEVKFYSYDTYSLKKMTYKLIMASTFTLT